MNPFNYLRRALHLGLLVTALKRFVLIITCIIFPINSFAESRYPDLPPHDQVDAALEGHINVLAAKSGVLIEQANQRKWNSGNYEFNLRAGSAQRKITSPGQTLREWDVSLERPIRLPNKVWIDSDIGSEGVAHAEQALGDAHHEAGRMLLHLWFNWLREQAQSTQWQQQVDILKQQALTTEKRLKAGDAPRMEWSQAQAAVAQANVSWHQATMRAQLAGNELIREFPAIQMPSQLATALPQPIEHDLAYWNDIILDHNHELGMIQAENRLQQLHAERSRAERLPDPTIGVRHSNEMGGNEIVTGLYLSLPISFGQRWASAEAAQYHADIAGHREAAARRRIVGDINAVHAQANSSYQIWQQAQEAANSIRQNAELVSRAYSLGESSLSETLTARRLALESALAANLAQLDANEARYRLLLDAHQLWAPDHNDHGKDTH
jgi:outer membrane protein TolC